MDTQDTTMRWGEPVGVPLPKSHPKPELLLTLESTGVEQVMDDLRKTLASYVPKTVKDETDVTELPFPVELVKDIKQIDVNRMGRIFKDTKPQGGLYRNYSTWRDTFLHINLVFIQKGKWEQAKAIRNEMQRLIENDYFRSAPLLLIPARLYLLLKGGPHISEIDQIADKETAAKLNQIDQDEKAIRKTLNELLKLIESENGGSWTLRSQVAQEIRRIRVANRVSLDEFIKNLIEKIRNVLDEEAGALKKIYKAGPDHLARYKPYHKDENPEIVYWVFNGFGEWIKEYKGWYRRTRSRLFRLWEIEVNEVAARMRKSRDKKEKVKNL